MIGHFRHLPTRCHPSRLGKQPNRRQILLKFYFFANIDM